MIAVVKLSRTRDVVLKALNSWKFTWLKGNDDSCSVFLKRNSISGDAQMNKDSFEGGVRVWEVGQGERFVGASTG